MGSDSDSDSKQLEPILKWANDVLPHLAAKHGEGKVVDVSILSDFQRKLLHNHIVFHGLNEKEREDLKELDDEDDRQGGEVDGDGNWLGMPFELKEEDLQPLEERVSYAAKSFDLFESSGLCDLRDALHQTDILNRCFMFNKGVGYWPIDPEELAHRCDDRKRKEKFRNEYDMYDGVMVEKLFSKMEELDKIVQECCDELMSRLVWGGKIRPNWEIEWATCPGVDETEEEAIFLRHYQKAEPILKDKWNFMKLVEGKLSMKCKMVEYLRPRGI